MLFCAQKCMKVDSQQKMPLNKAIVPAEEPIQSPAIVCKIMLAVYLQAISHHAYSVLQTVYRSQRNTNRNQISFRLFTVAIKVNCFTVYLFVGLFFICLFVFHCKY